MAFEDYDLAAKKLHTTSRHHALEWVVGARKTLYSLRHLEWPMHNFWGVLKSLAVKYIA
jgi:hypothetical protein